MPYNETTDINNEKAYLNNLIAGGGGNADWANNQMKVLDAFARKQASIADTQAPQQALPQVQPQPMQQVNQQPQMEQMLQFNQQMADANFQQQKAQLDMALESQVAQLKMAYEQAIADGQISVRDAEAQFESQKQAIQQQAYLNAERTGLYAQDMGIQNSQQAIGLMQGDNARNNSLINQNISERDKRINDIKDRLNSIKSQQNIDLVRAQSEYDYNVAGARASANQQMAQNAFNLMQDDYTFNRQAQHEYGLLNATHQKDLEKMAIGFDMDIQKMNIQQGFDIDKMNLSFNQQLEAMAKQNGYDIQLEGIRQSGRMAELEAQQHYQMKILEKEAEAKKQSLINTYTKGTPEYKAAERELELETRRAAALIMTENASNAWTEIVLSNPNLPAYGSEAMEKPKDYRASSYLDTEGVPNALVGLANIPGSLANVFTGYNSKMDKYNAQNSAVTNLQDYFKYSGIEPMPWTTEPKPGAIERMIKSLQGK